MARARAGPLAPGNAQESLAAVFMLIASAPFHNAVWLLLDPPTPLYPACRPCQSEIPQIAEDPFTINY